MPVLLVTGSLYFSRQSECQAPTLQEPNASELIVRNPVTGVQLDQITVRVAQVGVSRTAPQHPGLHAEEVVLGVTSSPVSFATESMQTDETECVYYVGSPGYAWKALSFDPTQAGTREVQLEEGGGLSIVFADAPAGARLRLRPEAQAGEEASFESAASSDAPVEIAGLLPATYRASIELDSSAGNTTILAEALVVVRGGRDSEYELHASLPRAK